MLNQAERYQVLRFLMHFCTVGLLPLEVDVKSWKIRPCAQPRWKRLLFRLSFASYCLHGMYQVLSLLHVWMFSRDTPTYQIMIHMIIASVTVVYSFVYYLFYVKYPEINAALFRMALTGSIVGRKRSPVPNHRGTK